jgi:hypothetical protein
MSASKPRLTHAVRQDRRREIGALGQTRPGGEDAAVSEDNWIDQLYRPELKALADYFERSDRSRATLTPHIVDLLRAGMSVVLDFYANTLGARRWMRGLFEAAGTTHELHFLDAR